MISSETEARSQKGKAFWATLLFVTHLCFFAPFYLLAEKASGKPVRLVRMRVASHALKLLFQEMVKKKVDS